jgi:Zn-dependent protease
MGRMTLNPAKHMEPMGLLCFVLAGIGWAKPVPVNPFNYRNFRRGNFWVSISGVLTNLFIAFLFSFGLYMFARFDLITMLPSGIVTSGNLFFFGLGWFFSLCMLLNVSLAVFNLLPIPPLDGYNLLISFTKPNNGFMLAMRNYGRIILLIVVLFGGVLLFTVRDFIQGAMLSFWGLFI